ncbi:MAG: pyridoxamine 5'-phosphate oxidase family protein [Azoarcus sp.]|nr:pyridoxamine 5'-phosphate oxidase family protein [Azoarcus sp.]
MSEHDPHAITRLEGLDALFGSVAAPSLKKEIDYIHPLYRQMIEASPFVVVATAGPDGLDASPRGDPAGFVVVEDERTLLLPERRGNNRVDSLRNLVRDPRIALLFLIPGVGETLRVNGRARISVAPALLTRFEMHGKPPRCVTVVSVERVYFQCARAIARSGLWNPAPADVKSRVPSPGCILDALTGGEVDAQRYDAALPARQRDTLY